MLGFRRGTSGKPNPDVKGGYHSSMTTQEQQQAHRRSLTLGRVAAYAASLWNPPTGSNAHHQMRVSRILRGWPEMAKALDALTEALPEHGDEDLLNPDRAVVPCPICGHPVATVHQQPDPKGTVGMTRYRATPCGHVVTAEAARELWARDVPIEKPRVDGIALVRAEQDRQRTDLGYTLAHDEDRSPGALAWAAWCILDHMQHPSEEVPPMWPWPPGAWKAYSDPVRSLTVVAALCASEIDRLIAAPDTSPPEPADGMWWRDRG